MNKQELMIYIRVITLMMEDVDKAVSESELYNDSDILSAYDKWNEISVRK